MIKARPRRSVLFMPGSNARALQKARTLDADVIIMDLEDAVLPSQRDDARKLISGALEEGGYAGHECLVRVNAISSPACKEDLHCLGNIQPDGIVFPKVNSVEQVKQIHAYLDEYNIHPEMPLWIMIEDAQGILSMQDILAASNSITAVLVGTADLAKSMRLPQTPGRLGLLNYLSQCVLVARANEVDIIDGIHQDFNDQKGFDRMCEQGRNLGFDGKSLIHPGQIEPCNRLFSPSTEELNEAKRIVEAWEQTDRKDSGIVVLDGKMIEHLHVDAARDMISRYSMIEQNRALREQ